MENSKQHDQTAKNVYNRKRDTASGEKEIKTIIFYTYSARSNGRVSWLISKPIQIWFLRHKTKEEIKEKSETKRQQNNSDNHKHKPRTNDNDIYHILPA